MPQPNTPTKHQPPKRQRCPSCAAAQKENRRLRAEIEELRAVGKELGAENQQLKKQVAELSEALEKAQRAGCAPRGASGRPLQPGQEEEPQKGWPQEGPSRGSAGESQAHRSDLESSRPGGLSRLRWRVREYERRS